MESREDFPEPAASTSSPSPALSGGASRSEGGGGERVPGAGRAWREAGLVLLLSTVFPGTGHVRARRYRRGLLGSLLALVFLVPLAFYCGLLAADFGSAWGRWLPLFSTLGFGFVIGLRPAIAILRLGSGRRLRAQVEGAPGFCAVALYGSVGLFLASVACLGLAHGLTERAHVRTSALEPLLSAGDEVIVFPSRFLRPTYEDVVTVRLPPPRAAEVGDASVLGFVLARPRDRIELRAGHVLVDGEPIEPARRGRNWRLEKAARAELRTRRLSRLVHPLTPSALSPPPGCEPGSSLPLDGADWGPWVLPEGIFLLLVDELPTPSGGSTAGPADPAAAAPSRRALFVHSRDIAARAHL